MVVELKTNLWKLKMFFFFFLTLEKSDGSM